MSLLQYDERLFLPEQKDQNLPHPTLDLQIVLFRLAHKDQTPIFQDHTILLHEKHQTQNKPLLREINEFLVWLLPPSRRLECSLPAEDRNVSNSVLHTGEMKAELD